MYIVKNIKITAEMKMAEVLLSNPYFILMLEHFEIPLEVQEKSVETVCRENGICVDVFLTFANLFNGLQYTPQSDYCNDDIQTMIKYLRNCHAYYLSEKCPEIQSLIHQMYSESNKNEILLVENFFNQYLSEITEHITYENEIVFPYIKNLVQNSKKGGSYSVLEYKDHHNDIEEKLTDIKNLLIKYLPPNDDTRIRRKLLIRLFELEYDLNIHSKIEDNILIPLVQRLEKQLGKN